MHFTFNNIRNLYSNQPFKYEEYAVLFLFTYAYGVIAGLLIFFNTPYQNAASSLILEQIAPTGIIAFSLLSIIMFVAYIIIHGPIENYQSKYIRSGIYIAKFGLALIFAETALKISVFTSVLISSASMPEHHSIQSFVKNIFTNIIAAHFLFSYYVLLMANQNYFSNFKNYLVILIYRVLAIFLAVAIALRVIHGLILFAASK